MLKQAKLKNFTTLPNETMVFAPGLNVIVAENGCGKTHLLKAIYSLLSVNTGKDLSKTGLQKNYADKLMGVFRPESLGRLVKRKQGRERCEIQLQMADSQQDCEINFASNAATGVQVEIVLSRHDPTAVYLPTRELVTLCPWFINLFTTTTIWNLKRPGAIPVHCWGLIGKRPSRKVGCQTDATTGRGHGQGKFLLRPIRDDFIYSSLARNWRCRWSPKVCENWQCWRG